MWYLSAGCSPPPDVLQFTGGKAGLAAGASQGFCFRILYIYIYVYIYIYI